MIFLIWLKRWKQRLKKIDTYGKEPEETLPVLLQRTRMNKCRRDVNGPLTSFSETIKRKETLHQMGNI